MNMSRLYRVREKKMHLQLVQMSGGSENDFNNASMFREWSILGQ